MIAGQKTPKAHIYRMGATRSLMDEVVRHLRPTGLSKASEQITTAAGSPTQPSMGKSRSRWRLWLGLHRAICSRKWMLIIG
jgi:hypothetical protein